ncbi:sulfurtransferase complex subunit TusD [Thalassolituus hydrocarboniclasticus]|uniref:Sulfurtransferase complex subunit TusD n=1 Tax=Thalassolituus hydrocarboniclasticus TaxID=2742796 RepID=A0ABY6AA08_9GAMM|nr:sulfurtransferase complex subunit TusD [Thalassolituus hydrocarboniclasticus]UXD87525.1 sulfurtransferase complex subunit TusD [Thalassolituus hydrocarboniclasticus]
MATFSLLMTQSPYSGVSHTLAQEFALSLLAQGHKLQRVFFYQDAVFAALSTQNPVQGQPSVSQQWLALAADHDFPLQVCIANALRRGVIDKAEQQRYNLPTDTLATGFELTGLGEMAEAALDSDRIIDF